MKRSWIDRLASPTTGAGLALDAVRVAEDEVVEGFLVADDDRAVWPIVAGVAVLPRDLVAHLHAQGGVYRRTPMNDPRLARSLLGRAGLGYVVVPFDEVVAHYRDLARDPPPGYDTSPHPDPRDLAALAARLGLHGHGAVVGASVGREVFALAAILDGVLGLDRSIACVRRARNIAVTVEDFFLPAPKGSGLKEIPLDLGALARAAADFALADADALPLRTAALDLVVLHARDALGPWPDAEAAWREAWRVVRPGGWVLHHAELAVAGAGAPEPAEREGVWCAVPRP